MNLFYLLFPYIAFIISLNTLDIFPYCKFKPHIFIWVKIYRTNLTTSIYWAELWIFRTKFRKQTISIMNVAYIIWWKHFAYVEWENYILKRYSTIIEWLNLPVLKKLNIISSTKLYFFMHKRQWINAFVFLLNLVIVEV